jgi:predicted nucleic acid-binding protein
LHRLSDGVVSPDTSVIVDFSLIGQLDLFLNLFTDRMLLSDFVQAELAPAGINLPEVEVIRLENDEQWNFFNDLQKTKPGLGIGELGALTVAQFRHATLLSNDKPARQMAETLGVAYSGGIGVLEYCCEAGKLSAQGAIDLLDKMVAAGARISEDLIANFRQTVLNN